MLLSGEADGVGSWLLGILSKTLLHWLVSFLIGTASYVLTGWGLYAAAKRRGIPHPWLAWLPLGRLWILGRLADHYQYEKNQRVCRWSCWLIFTAVLAGICSTFMTKTYRSTFSAILQGFLSGGDILGILEESIGGILIFTIIHLVIALMAAVLDYIVLYTYYKSCLPKKAKIFLVLSILFSVTRPFFVFHCRKWDLGLPGGEQELPPVSQQST